MQKKNRTLFLLVGICLVLIQTKAQESLTKDEFHPSGKVYGRIFTNFNTSLKGPDKQTAFEVRRAYLGYKYLISPEFSAEIKLDIGSPNDAEYSLQRRFGYFKTAAIYYQPIENLQLTFGLQDVMQFKQQEKFWNRRYIVRPFMDIYSFGPSADIGIKAIWDRKLFNLDIAFFNGEGYSSLQNDNTFKAALGLTVFPAHRWTVRIYGDLSSKSIHQSTAVMFVGYSHDLFSLGGEYAMHWNRDFRENHNVNGYSIKSDAKILPRTKIFLRYDKIDSNILEGESTPWNLANDESALTTGIEYIPITNIRIAANYQDHYPQARNMDMVAAFFLNIEASF
ncbi:porin [Thermophagus sp. OGC60D27]|uniref:porin n=1 Tax=Thermophagus sp. OGC60D27 TaxID=3458415 RepID=UPI00403763C3